jgi:type IV secretory pathway TrbF-like protein
LIFCFFTTNSIWNSVVGKCRKEAEVPFLFPFLSLLLSLFWILCIVLAYRLM